MTEQHPFKWRHFQADMVLSELRTQKLLKASWNADVCSSLATRRLVAVLVRRQVDHGKPVVVQ